MISNASERTHFNCQAKRKASILKKRPLPQEGNYVHNTRMGSIFAWTVHAAGKHSEYPVNLADPAATTTAKIKKQLQLPKASGVAIPGC